jgi:hypothetical protein
MSAWDDFTAKLKCLTCGREGIVHLREADGRAYARDKSRSVTKLPDGFSIIYKNSDNPKFSCMQCGGLIEAK